MTDLDRAWRSTPYARRVGILAFVGQNVLGMPRSY